MDLNRYVGKSVPDNLITDLYPEAKVQHVKITKLAAETTYKRGTVLGVESGGAVKLLGTAGATLTASFVLAEDTVIGTGEDTVAVVYRSGCFSPAHIIVTEGYTMTANDIDALRTRDIVFKDFMS
jgi:hypothetical protein